MVNSYLACQVGVSHPCLMVKNGATNRMDLWPLSPGADGLNDSRRYCHCDIGTRSTLAGRFVTWYSDG